MREAKRPRKTWQDEDVVILGCARTPIGDFLGALKDVSLGELSRISGQAALERAGIAPELIEEVAMGCVLKHGNKGNPARQTALGLGIRPESWAYTIDQQCASGMKAVDLIYRSLLTGGCQIGLALGSESMSRVPHLLTNLRSGKRMGDDTILDVLTHDGLVCAMAGTHMGVTAETLAKQYQITRAEQDELALLSHHRAAEAQRRGGFAEELVPVRRDGRIICEKDEHPRENLGIDSLAKLSPAFVKDGTVTAGNASSLNDGSAAAVLATGRFAKAHGLTPQARILASVSYGVAPEVMGIGPALALPKALEKAGLKQSDIDLFEINEAFAAQFIAVKRELNLDMAKVNVNGSGIGLGHPVGCTGLRIIVSLLHELKRRNQSLGAASLCVGGGPAMAVVIERL